MKIIFTGETILDYDEGVYGIFNWYCGVFYEHYDRVDIPTHIVTYETEKRAREIIDEIHQAYKDDMVVYEIPED